MRAEMLILLVAYDEEDGDFVFTRGSKRTKTAPAAPEPEPAPVLPQTAKRGRKPKAPEDEAITTEKKPRARKMSFSTPSGGSDAIVNPRKRKSTRSSVGKQQNGETSAITSRTDHTDYDSIDMVGSPSANEGNSADSSKQGTLIALPFSDTPVINRNKEMRKKGTGSRRSSLGLRGRRASSLIDSGHSAIPHREVETAEFYKHIEADGLSEPRRMKQLLTWTGERCLGEKPAHGEANELAEQAGEKYFPKLCTMR